MTIQFKRSKKLERALRCMREPHMDYDLMRLSSAVSSTAMSDASNTTTDDNVDHSSSMIQEDQKKIPIDPETMMKGEVDICRNNGDGDVLKKRLSKVEIQNQIEEELQMLVKLAQNQSAQRVDNMGTGKQGLCTNPTIDLRKELPLDLRKNLLRGKKDRKFDIVATRRKGVSYKADELKFTGHHKPNRNLRELDAYQNELFRTIEEFEARKPQRLQKLGFVNRPSAKTNTAIFREDDVNMFQEGVQPKAQAPVAAEDRNDAPSGWTPNPLPPDYSTHSKESNLPKPSGVAAAMYQSPAMYQPHAKVNNLRVANISGRIPPPKPQREGPVATLQANNKPTTNKDVIMSHLASVASHLIQTQKMMGTSGNQDLNRRMLRENTTELLRNLAMIQRLEQERSNSVDKRKQSVPETIIEPKAVKPNDVNTRSVPTNNIMLLRAKRDEAAMAVHRGLVASRLENSASGAQMAISPKKGHDGEKRKEKRSYPAKKKTVPGSGQIISRHMDGYDHAEFDPVREKPIPSNRQRVSRNTTSKDDQAEFDLYEDRADRLDRVKSMIEELRYLRSAK